jgi:uncharacterized membrane protein
VLFLALSQNTKSLTDLWLELYDTEWKGYNDVQTIAQVSPSICLSVSTYTTKGENDSLGRDEQANPV